MTFSLNSILKVATIAAILPLAGFGLWTVTARADAQLPVNAPAPTLDEHPPATTETAVFAGGCFWGVQGVFQHVKGVKSTLAGYAGGTVANPTYEQVGLENTGHAESVEVVFDPSQVSYGQLLQIFFSVITDPTTKDRQGNDAGPSYRSALFTMSDQQAKVASAYIAQLDAAKIYPAPIVTEVTPYTNFYRAEDYHQDNAYTERDNAPYLDAFDEPKIANMKAQFPTLWMDRPVLVFASNYRA